MSLVTKKRNQPRRWMSIFDDMDEFFSTREDRFSMPIDLMEKGDDYIIKATLPGVSKNMINIDVNQAERYIDIKIEKNDENEDTHEESGVKYLHRERYFGSISRRIRFGTPIAPDKATTELKDGVLTITLPKSEEAKTVTLPLG